ncbi:sigma-70 family RNA polymerase sigma factor [Acaryochloris marina]|uniref:sigma-70 family RNA polymerase sigma factor n=1 Tax=Acaryochloris marina TaxID=155978 RepID=UPI001BAFB85C|nr:sigma-70 family RNA polymerase sigma factor [Acaryochloris marina]QUY45953.1 sigma-70 family RNA polymerase sigma factor [Acaryochloris marina S15]
MYSNQLHQGLCFDASVSAAIERTSRLSPELESALILRAKQGDHEARQQIISANLAWISAVGGRSSGRGLEDDELLSAGVIGLNEAIDRWDPEQQSNIRTYGQFWIRKFQSESLFQTDTIRIPKSAHEQLAKLRKAQRVLGQEATVSEIAEYTQLREKRILELQSISQPTSLNVGIGAEGHTELLDLQADESCEGSDLPLSPELKNLVQRLNPRQQEVIRLRFLEGWTFKDIGGFFSLTSQRIQQICKAALEKLKGWLVGGIDEPVVESAPVPQRWQHYVFAKVLLATEFCCKSLKRQFQKCFNRFLIPLHLPFHPLKKNTDTKLYLKV